MLAGIVTLNTLLQVPPRNREGGPVLSARHYVGRADRNHKHDSRGYHAMELCGCHRQTS